MGLILALLFVAAMGGALVWLLAQEQKEDRTYDSRNDAPGPGQY